MQTGLGLLQKFLTSCFAFRKVKRDFKAALSMQLRGILPQDKLSSKASPRRGKEGGLTLQTTARMSLGEATKYNNKQALP